MRHPFPGLRRRLLLPLVAVCALLPALVRAQATEAPIESLDSIKATMMIESQARHAGPCACPDHRKANGARCGGTSAHSRAGGQRPYCALAEISDAMAVDWLLTRQKALARPSSTP
ncbi:MAG: hypothetical protein QG612_2617 [Pseudomonadota bacterium]|nr:hypothetical protein [Pseudomonadota bacterium]